MYRSQAVKEISAFRFVFLEKTFERKNRMIQRVLAQARLIRRSHGIRTVISLPNGYQGSVSTYIRVPGTSLSYQDYVVGHRNDMGHNFRISRAFSTRRRGRGGSSTISFNNKEDTATDQSAPPPSRRPENAWVAVKDEISGQTVSLKSPFCSFL